MRSPFALALLVALLAPAAAAQPAFSKGFSPSTIGPGNFSTLTFTIDNTNSGVVATGLSFADTLPAGMTVASPSGLATTCAGGGRDGGEPVLSGASGGTTVSLSGASIAGGATCQVTVRVTASTPGVMTNTSGELTSSAGNSGTASANLTVDSSRPAFSKSFADPTVAIGARTTLTFTIDNSANASAVNNLDFTDTFPAGLEVAGPANASTTCGTTTLPPTLTASPGGTTVILDANGTFGFPAVAAEATCTVSVDVTATGGGTLENTTELQADFVSVGSGGDVLDVVASTLRLDKNFLDDPVAPGGTSRLRFRLRNLSRAGAATGLAFSDDLDATLSGLVATGLPFAACGGTVSSPNGGSTIELSGGTLASAEQCSFVVPVVVPVGAAPGVYVNTTSAVAATIDGSPAAGAPATDDLYVAAVPTFTKEFTDDPVVPGETVTLQFTIGNTSQTAEATEISFTDELTTFLPFPVSADLPTPGFCGPGSSAQLVVPGTDQHALQVTGASLAAGASCTFSVGLDIPAGLAGGTYASTTEPITATVDGQRVVGGRAADDLVVVGAPRLTKRFRNQPVAPGGTSTLEFALTVADEAPGDATAVAFTDDLDATLTGLTATGLPVAACGGTLSSSDGGMTLDYSGGTVAPGETCEFSVVTQVPAGAAPGTYTNTTSDVTATVGGVATVGQPATADLEVTSLTFTKEFIDDPVAPGASTTLRFTFANDGADAAAIDLFTDDLSAMLSGAAATNTPVAGCGGTLTGTSTLVFVAGSVAAATSCFFDVTVSVPGAAEAGSYRNRTSRPQVTVDGSSFALQAASDFLVVDVSTPPLFSKAFAPAEIPEGGTSTLTFTIDNGANAQPATALAFSDTFPAGMEIADPADASTTCTGGTGEASPGATAFTYAGGSVAGGEICTVSFSVTAATADAYENTTGDLTSSLGNSGSASATLTVRTALLTATKADAMLADADEDGRVGNGDTVRYTVVVTNLDARDSPILAFSDDPDAQTALVVGSVTTTQGTVTSGNTAGDASVAVDLGALAPEAAVTITFDVVADALASELVCNQGTVTGAALVLSTDDPDTPVSDDATCRVAEPNQPPVADAGPDATYECVGPNGAVVMLDGSGSSDPDEDVLMYTWTGPFSEGEGTVTGVNPTVTLPVGVHEITLTVEDPSGETATDTVTITVEDTTGPTITVAAERLSFWPPDHRYETIDLGDLGIAVEDGCSTGVSNVVITQVTSDEPENGAGDGNTADDIVIAPTCDSVQVRIERQIRGNGRVYTLTLAAADGAGNVGTATYEVAAPKSRSREAVKDATQYTVVGCDPNAPLAQATGPETAAVPFGAASVAIPEELSLGAVFPNPFGQTTTVAYGLPEAGPVRLAVYDALGREVAVLVDGAVEAGAYRATFDASALPSGTYLVRMTTPGGFDQSRPVTVLR